jgi:hypothetical protein
VPPAAGWNQAYLNWNAHNGSTLGCQILDLLQNPFNPPIIDDGRNDYIGYYSGDNSTAANRPQLVVTYQ